MSKKIFFLSFLLSLNFSFAQIINGIAVIVENEPITMHEVFKTSELLKTSQKDALNFLIKDRLEKAQIKTLKIEADSFEIGERLEKIAKENGLNVSGLRSAVISQGMDYSQFRDDVANTIKQEKLYQTIFKDARINVTPEGARGYFEQNPQMFMQFENIKAIRYISASQEALELMKASPMSAHNNVSAENLDLKSEQIPPQLRAIFNQTPNGAFTRIFKTPSGFETFLVTSKDGQTIPKFEDVQNEVIAAIYKLEEERVISEYFNKLRAKADIKYLR